jgi:hypothetical protein
MAQQWTGHGRDGRPFNKLKATSKFISVARRPGVDMSSANKNSEKIDVDAYSTIPNETRIES